MPLLLLLLLALLVLLLLLLLDGVGIFSGRGLWGQQRVVVDCCFHH